MAITPISGVLGRTTAYSSDATGLTNFQAEWLTAAQNQGITIAGTTTSTFNNTGTADLSALNYSTNPPQNLSNLSFTRTGQAGNDTFGDIFGIGVADSYDGWWNDAKKVRAEINYNPNNGESQVLTFKWGPNQTIQSAAIDLSLFAPKSAEKFGDEVGFLQAFKNGQLVDITATRIGGGLSSSIDNSGIGVKFRADDGVNGDFKFQISNANFDELRFTARAYDNPVSAQPKTNGIITDSSDYLVQQITYSGTVDTPVLQFSNPQYVVGEDGTPVLAVTVVRSGGLEGPASATVNLSNGTAVAPGDYNNTPITVNFADGQTSQVITVPIVDDLLVELDETVNLTLVNPSPGATIGTQNTAVLTILDNDVPPPPKPLVFVAALDPNAGEPGRTDNSGDGVFQFARTGGDITQPLTIRYTVTGTATPGTDYAALSGTVTIAANQSVSAPVTFTPVTDGVNEPVETVTVKIAEDLPYQVGSADTATVRVLDNDPLTGTPANNGRVLRYNQSGAFVTSYNTITEAVTAAVANDIIVPQAGFYAEPNTITINQPLTIRGTNAGVSAGSGSTVAPSVVSTAPGLPVFTILPNVNNVTIEGMTIQLGGDNSNGIRLQGVSDNLVIRQNVFNGQGPSSGGVIFLDSGSTGGSANIIDNLIRDVSTNPGSTTSGVQAFRQNTVRITDNVIANLTGPGIAADSITNPASIITNNRVTNAGEQGIQLAGGNATIENNEIADTNISQGVDRAGIRLRNSGFDPAAGGLLLGTANVRSNLITNSYNGVAVRDGTAVPASLKVNFNNLIGNTNAALYHGGTGTLDATNNWWDDSTGPVVGGTGRNRIAGSGANLVTFNPFATSPF